MAFCEFVARNHIAICTVKHELVLTSRLACTPSLGIKLSYERLSGVKTDLTSRASMLITVALSTEMDTRHVMYILLFARPPPLRLPLRLQT